MLQMKTMVLPKFSRHFPNNWKWSFMTVVFAIPYLPRSMESGVRIEISGCLFKRLLNHLLDVPLLVLIVTSLFLSILIISRAKACLIYDFYFHYAFLLLRTVYFFTFNFLSIFMYISQFICICKWPLK